MDLEKNKFITSKIEDGIAYITLNRPEVHNAFNSEMINELLCTFQHLDVTEEIVAVVLTGNGKSFSAGADLNWMKEASTYTEEQNRKDAEQLALMLNSLYSLSKVTISSVNGAAMGGGMGLVCCCDIVIAQENAKFALSEVKLGLIPATISPYVMRAIGYRNARRYFQTGERISAQRAYHIGLVHELAESNEQAQDMLNDVLNQIRMNGPAAMSLSKKLCELVSYKEIDGPLMELTSDLIAKVRSSKEAKEGINAFLEKRKAYWIDT
jgi:methylglutaconyl-CoA hydratase